MCKLLLIRKHPAIKPGVIPYRYRGLEGQLFHGYGK